LALYINHYRVHSEKKDKKERRGGCHSRCVSWRKGWGAEPIPTNQKSLAFYTIIVLRIWIMNCVLFGVLDINVGGFLTIFYYENYAGYLPAVPDTVFFAVFGLGL
jgi:hypothetical protein